MRSSDIAPPTYERVVRQVWEMHSADLVFIATYTREGTYLHRCTFGGLFVSSICHMRLSASGYPSRFVQPELSHAHLKR